MKTSPPGSNNLYERSDTTGDLKLPVRFSTIDRIHWPLERSGHDVTLATTHAERPRGGYDWEIFRNPKETTEEIIYLPKRGTNSTDSSIDSPPTSPSPQQDDVFEGIYEKMTVAPEETLLEILPSIAEPWKKVFKSIFFGSSGGKQHMNRRRGHHRHGSSKDHSGHSRRGRHHYRSENSSHHHDERVCERRRGASSTNIDDDGASRERSASEPSRHPRRRKRRSESPPVTWGQWLDNLDSVTALDRHGDDRSSPDESDREENQYVERQASEPQPTTRKARRDEIEETPASPRNQVSGSPSSQTSTQYVPTHPDIRGPSAPYAPPLSGAAIPRRSSAIHSPSAYEAESPRRWTETSTTIMEKTSTYPIETLGRDGSRRVEHITVTADPIQVDRFRYSNPQDSDDMITVEHDGSEVDGSSRFAPTSRYKPTKGQPGYVSPDRKDIIEKEGLSITIKDRPSPPGRFQQRSEYSSETLPRSDRAGHGNRQATDDDRSQDRQRADAGYFPTGQTYANGNYSPQRRVSTSQGSYSPRGHPKDTKGRYRPGRYEDAPRPVRDDSGYSSRTSPVENDVKFPRDQGSRAPSERHLMNGGRPSYTKSENSTSPSTYSPNSTIPPSPSRMSYNGPMSLNESSTASRAYRPHESFPTKARYPAPNADTSRRPSQTTSTIQPSTFVKAAPRPPPRSDVSKNSLVSQSRSKGSTGKPMYDDPESDVESTVGVFGGDGPSKLDERERRRLEHRRMSMFEKDVEGSENERRR
ncbi:hypothetical protein IAR50_003293 [Cryptococcus sp. DSM 104548]